jgi:hypothetical protein
MAFSRFELELFFKTYVAVIFTYVAPCMIFFFVAHNTPAAQRGTMLAALYPVMLGIIILFVSLYSLATQVVTYREMGFYKRILLTRITPVGIALSNAIRGFVLVFIGLIILSAESWILFGVRPSYNPLQSLIAICFAGGGFFLFGLIPACFVKKTQSMFALASVFSYILVFFSGTVPSFGKLFHWLIYVVPAWPSYHALRILRAGFAGALFQTSILVSVAYMVALTAVCLLVIRKYLSWT